jgi:hypothetical protein
MEIKNDFDLNNSVGLWRQEPLALGEILPGEIRELESHLHSSMDGLKQRGVGEEEAFWLARRRLTTDLQKIRAGPNPGSHRAHLGF